MRAAFIPALPPSALMGGMIAPSFRLVNRFPEKSWFARAAAVSGRPRCAHYGLGRRSLAGGSHTHPTLAVAWAAFAANDGGASVSSAFSARNAACCTAPLATPVQPPAPAAGRSAARARSRRGRRVPAPTARAMGAQRPRASVSSAHLAQETRLVAPRSCPRRATLLRTARQKPRRARPLPPRQARPRAHRSRHGCGLPRSRRTPAFRAPFMAQETRHVAPPRSLRP